MEDQIRDRLIVAVRNYRNDTNSRSLMDFLQSNVRVYCSYRCKDTGIYTGVAEITAYNGSLTAQRMYF